MTHIMRTLVLLSACLLSHNAHLFADDKPEPKTSYYLIGNSLTWDTVPSALDGDVQWHVDCGKSLPYITKNPEKPCVKTSTLWPKALKEKQYDYISVQPHYGSTFKEDVEVISHWMNMQPKAIFIIHTGWARQKTRETEYASTDTTGTMAHSPAYIKALIAELKKEFPKREIRQTGAIDLLAEIAADIETGKAPFKDMEELHRDAIHMKQQTGRYLMHNAMRQVMDQPLSQGEKPFEKVTDEHKAYFQNLLKERK